MHLPPSECARCGQHSRIPNDDFSYRRFFQRDRVKRTNRSPNSKEYSFCNGTCLQITDLANDTPTRVERAKPGCFLASASSRRLDLRVCYNTQRVKSSFWKDCILFIVSCVDSQKFKAAARLKGKTSFAHPPDFGQGPRSPEVMTGKSNVCFRLQT